MTDAKFSRADMMRRAGGAVAAVGVAPWWRLAARPRDVRIRELDAALVGDVVGRTDPGYESARLIFDRTFDGVRPRAVAYCAGPEDVQRALAWARKYDVRLAPRCGGHSYGGYSTTPGLVIDVSRMRDISFAGETVHVGAGARLADVYGAVGARGLALPAGSCAGVGISGITLGGGHGFLARKWGLTADNVREFELVTAAGNRVVCGPAEQSSLFWACRGGGGGNYGIVTRWTFRTHPLAGVSTFRIDWPIAQLAAVLIVWQELAPHAPDELFSMLSVGKDWVSAVGQLVGSKAVLDELIAPLVAVGQPVRVSSTGRSYLDAMSMWAGCSALDTCYVGPGGKLERAAFAAKSHYVRAPLPPEAAGVIRNALAASPGRALLLLESYGGAINRVPKDATAFVHRDALLSLQYLAYWNYLPEAAASRRWLRSFANAMRPYVSGEAYQNYIDPELRGWQRAYYGSNLERLVEVKKRYDPDNVFRFAQSIPTRL